MSADLLPTDRLPPTQGYGTPAPEQRLPDITELPVITGQPRDYGIDYSESPNTALRMGVWESAFKRETTIGSIMSREDAGLTFTDDGTNPFEDNAPFPQYANRPELFVDVFNKQALARRRAQIDKEDEMLAVQQRHPIASTAAAMAVQFVDPVNWLPMMTVAKIGKGAYALGRAGMSVGTVGAMGAVGASAAAATAAQEAILQSQQQLRTWDESATAIGGSFVLGGLLGVGAANLAKAFSTSANRSALATVDAMIATNGNAGAASVATPAMVDIVTRMKASERVTTQEIEAATKTAMFEARAGRDLSDPDVIARVQFIDQLSTEIQRAARVSLTSELEGVVRNSFGSDGARLLDQGGVKVVQSVEDLPARPDGVPHFNDTKGMFDGNKAYIVADNVAGEDLRGVLLHEVGVHYGMQKMLGDVQFKQLLDDVTARAQAGEAAFAAARAAVPKETPPQHMAEEVLAYLVENAPQTGIVQRVIAAVKQFIRQVTGGAYSNLSEAEIRQLAVSSLRKWNPEARPSEIRYSRSQTDTPEFKRWFGKSKVVDKDGKPLVMYHGTARDFDKFDVSKSQSGEGLYFTSVPDQAGRFANPKRGDSPNVMPAYLRLENPMDLGTAPGGIQQWVAIGKKNGHDGLIVLNEDGTPRIAVVFEPTQIKSATGNTGAFDPSNPDIRYSRRQTETPEFKRWSNDAPLITSDEAQTRQFRTGEKIVVEAFHGTKRPDRIDSKFLKKRATSGPMAYHTSSPELASRYAMQKQDTSLAYEDGNYENWFKFRPAGSRSDVSIDRAWFFLSSEQKQKIADLAPRVTMDDDLNIVLGPESLKNGLGGYDQSLAETRTRFDRQGNPLKALVDQFLNGGNLFDNEAKFLDVLEKAGFPMKEVKFDSPNAEFPAVYKNYIAMRNPLVTSDVPERVVKALEAAAKTDRSKAQAGGADSWDKNTRTLRDWVAMFKQEDNKYAWTSIPDKVTEVLKREGYDGIVDWSGKGGGEIAPVYIPFGETQVKSALGNRGTFDPTKNDIRFSRGGSRNERIAEQLQALSKALENIDNPDAFASVLGARAGSVGAEAVSEASKEDLQTYGKLANKVQDATWFLNPILRMRESPVAVVSRIGQQLWEDVVKSNMHMKGQTLGPQVETLIRQQLASMLGQGAQKHAALHMEAVKSGARLTKQQFSEAISYAMRRGDEHEIPAVVKAAKMWREVVFDPLKRMAQETRIANTGKFLLDPDIETKFAESYLHRMANHQKLMADEFGFKRAVSDWMESAIRNEYTKDAAATRARLALFDQDAVDLQLDPETRLRELEKLEKAYEDLDARFSREADIRRQDNALMAKAAELRRKGDRGGAKTALEEARNVRKSGGERYGEYLNAYKGLNRRQKNVDFGFAGMAERQDEIVGKMGDIHDANLRALDRLVAKGQKLERDLARLDPQMRREKIAELREQFQAVIDRQAKGAERVRKMLEKNQADADLRLEADKAGITEVTRGEDGRINGFKSKKKGVAKPVSLVEYIRRGGGIKLDGETGEWKAAGKLVREDGKSVDSHWREALIEAGYFAPDEDGGMARNITDELINAIEREAGGDKVYSIYDRDIIAAKASRKTEKLDKEVSTVLSALNDVGIREKDVDERALTMAAIEVAGDGKVDPTDAYERAVINLADQEAEARDNKRLMKAKSREQLSYQQKAIGVRLQRETVAANRRMEKMSSISARLDRIESFDLDGQVAELREAVDRLIVQQSDMMIGRGDKVQRLKDKLARVDPAIVQKKLAEIAADKKALEQKFYTRWETNMGGEGVDMNATVAQPRFTEWAKTYADQAFQNYSGRSQLAGTMPDFAIPLQAGPLAERTLPVPDTVLEPWLENDIGTIAGRYARSMLGQIEVTRKFGRPGMDDQLKQVEDAYIALREKVNAAPTVKDMMALVDQQPSLRNAFEAWARGNPEMKVTKERLFEWLTKREKSDIEDIKAGLELMLGKYMNAENLSDFGSLSRTLTMFNTLTKLGGYVIGSLTDVFRPAMIHGMGQYLSHGVLPLVTNLEGFRASKAELAKAGVGIEKWLRGYTTMQAGVLDPYAPGTMAERLMEKLSRQGAKFSGMTVFNDFTRQIGGMSSMDMILQSSVQKSNKDYLAVLGIDPGMAQRIADQFRAHGRDISGTLVAETDKWSDVEAVRVFRAAVSKDVSTAFVEKSVGDVPLLANRPLGKLLFQFRTFTLASNQRVLMRGLQDDHTRLVGALVAMTAIGMLVATLRSLRGGEDRWEKFKRSAQNPGFMIGEGLDNSGIFALLFEGANTFEKLSQSAGTSINPIKDPLRRMFPNAPQQAESTRFVRRDPLSSVLGPSASIPQDIGKAFGGDTGAMQRLSPFLSSHPPFRDLIQIMQGEHALQ